MDFTQIVSNVLTIGGIAGIIAVIITLAISLRYFRHGPEDPPQVLVHALTTILGFYFGAGAQSAMQTATLAAGGG